MCFGRLIKQRHSSVVFPEGHLPLGGLFGLTQQSCKVGLLCSRQERSGRGGRKRIISRYLTLISASCALCGNTREHDLVMSSVKRCT